MLRTGAGPLGVGSLFSHKLRVRLELVCKYACVLASSILIVPFGSLAYQQQVVVRENCADAMHKSRKVFVLVSEDGTIKIWHDYYSSPVMTMTREQMLVSWLNGDEEVMAGLEPGVYYLVLHKRYRKWKYKWALVPGTEAKTLERHHTLVSRHTYK